MSEAQTKTKTRDLARTKRSILQAGREEFSTFGLSGARVDRIAKNAGVNKQMIYYIFGGKEDLYLAALESLWETKTEIVDSTLLTDQVGFEGLPDLTANLYEAFQKNKEAVGMLLHDLMAGGEFLKKLKAKRPQLFSSFGLLMDFFDSLSKNGIIRQANPEKAVVAIATFLIAYPILQDSLKVFVETDSDTYKSLTDVESWKDFIRDLVNIVMFHPKHA